jgi:hypothetical protein
MLLAVAQAGPVRVQGDPFRVASSRQFGQQRLALQSQPGHRGPQLGFAPLQLAEFALVLSLLRTDFPIAQFVAQAIHVLAERVQGGVQRGTYRGALAGTRLGRSQLGDRLLQAIEAVLQPPQGAARVGIQAEINTGQDSRPVAQTATAVLQVLQHASPTL